MNTYIVTVTAADRVGIVHAVTETLRDWGGNILELSQTVMRGYFTIILAVEFPEVLEPSELREAIAARGRRFRLHVAVVQAEAEARVPPVPHGERFIVTVLGDDRLGTIHGIAGFLAERGVNIVDLHARTDSGRFSMIMEAFLPPELSPAEVKAVLERFGRERGLESYVQHENIFLATTEPRPVRVGPAPNPQGDAVVPH